MHLGTKTASEYFMKDDNIIMHKIQRVNQEKDLGVIFDNELKFDEHIKHKVNIANRNLGIIYRKFSYLDQTMFNNLYKTMVRPHLECASVIWNPHHKRLKVLLENVQRRATRMLKGLRFSKMIYNERMLKLGIPSLEYRRTRSDILQVYRLIQNIDVVPSDIINMAGQTVTRGHKFKFLKENMNTNRYKKCFSNRVEL